MYYRLLFIAILSCMTLTGCPPGGEGGLWVENQVISIDGVDRYFRYFIPDTLQAGAPLVFLLHGGTRGMDTLTNNQAGGPQEWVTIAAEAGFLLVLPNGLNVDTSSPVGEDQNWNDCRADAPASETFADDVSFIEDLITWANVQHDIDTSRVYATGASNGGMMSFRLAVELGNQIAAIAAFIANMPGDSECGAPAVPVPAFICNATADPLMPWAGRDAPHPRGSLLSATATRDFWIATNGCSTTPVALVDFPDLDDGEGATVSSALYTNAGTGDAVLFLTVDGGGHTMPTITHPISDALLALLLLGPQNHDIEGAREAWAFMKQHVR